MAHEVAASWRTALIGLTRAGCFFLEAMTRGAPFQTVAACCCAGESDERARSLGVPVVSSIAELVRRPDIEVLWVAATDWLKEPWAADVLRSRKLIVSEPPLAWDSASATAAFQVVCEHGSRLVVHWPRRHDEDFQRALSVARSPDAGAVRAAKFVSWAYGLPATGMASNFLHQAQDDVFKDTLLSGFAQTMAQLVELVRQRPLRVVAASSPALGQRSEAVWLAVRIEFDGGATADVDLRLDSPAPLQTGWAVTCERGGYLHGRRFSLATDGEIFDVPISTTTPENSFVAVTRSLCEHNSADETLRELTVTGLLEAMLRSLQTGSATHL